MPADDGPAARYQQPFAGFPARDDHDKRWVSLARAIAAERGRVSDDPAAITPATEPGELIVIGSGIEAAGFTEQDEALLRDADEVFFCVADPATVVWIKARRPDAYDLYVLYDDSKRRYLTYMQMTEAMLHFVRRGRRVVAIFYGHPGIFVLSTHRAIAIARREGHRAVMRAAVSALDALCADLGVDPSQPGLQTFEATDMLIRGRRIDPSIHLVVWQVGLVGDLGFRRQGFLNRGFSLLLDYLEEVYGPDHTVVNYIASRYPGIDPLTDARPLAAFRDPAVQETVTGISTFYLPPSQPASADEAMLISLGLLRPGRMVRAPAGPLREIDKYGPRELRAFRDFAFFRVPAGYHWQEDTAAARFVLALRDDRELRDRYAADPVAAVTGWGAHLLSARERAQLTRRDPGALQVAAKGMPAADLRARPLVTTLLTSSTAARTLLRAVRGGDAREPAELLARAGSPGAKVVGSAEPGPRDTWAALARELDATLAWSLYPWTALYLAPDQETSLFLFGGHGPKGRDRAYLNGRPLAGISYGNGILRWRAQDGNPGSGHLRTLLTSRGARWLAGVTWPPDGTAADGGRLRAKEHVLPAVGPAGAAAPDPACLRGDYVMRVARGGSARLARLSVGGDGLLIDGKPASPAEGRGAAVAWTGGPGELAEGKMAAVTDPITGRPLLFGTGGNHGGRPRALVAAMPVGPAEEAALAAAPGLGLPGWAWPHLVAAAAAASQTGGLFLWHRWQRAAGNLRLTRAALTRALR